MTDPFDLAHQLNLTDQIDLTGPFDVADQINFTDPSDLTNQLNLTDPFDLKDQFDQRDQYDLTNQLNLTDQLDLKAQFDQRDQYDLTDLFEGLQHFLPLAEVSEQQLQRPRDERRVVVHAQVQQHAQERPPPLGVQVQVDLLRAPACEQYRKSSSNPFTPTFKQYVLPTF